MEQCPVCGAATRPGAKFCTSCGTRLEPRQSDPTQETQIAQPASDTTGDDATTVEPAAPETGDAGDTTADETTSWSGAWARSDASSDDPAARFESALDRSEQKAEDTASGGWSWGSTSTTEEEEPAPEQGDATADTGWRTPISDMGDEDKDDQAPLDEVAPDTEESETFRVVPEDTGGADTDSGDEPLAATAAASIAATGGDDARRRATELIDELRRLVWTIGEDEADPADNQRAIINNMKRLRGDTADFSDLRGVIDAARNNPRDIDALRDLADHAGRLGDLLDSHDRLRSALEDAIRGDTEQEPS